MEQDRKALLEMMGRPAFLVVDGIIVHCNEMAKNRYVPEGKPIQTLLPEGYEDYAAFEGGILHLTLQLGSVSCGATVTKQQDGDIFLMERNMDREQLQILALAAQQLRTPLSNVFLAAEALADDQITAADRSSHAGHMRQGLLQLLRIIGNMADADRIFQQEYQSMQTTELNGFFREIFEKADTLLAENRIRVQYTGSEKSIFTQADREQLERAAWNILSNAVKFSPKDSCIRVTLNRKGKLARLTVEDEGEGITVDGDLFERYRREPAIEDSRYGLGLGITLIQATASAHGGTVLIDKPKGTRVTLTLAIRSTVPGVLRTPALRISSYTAGWDPGLMEFSETLPLSAYEKDF